MKRILFAVIAVLILSCFASAQTVSVVGLDDTIIATYRLDQIKQILFTPEESGTGDNDEPSSSVSSEFVGNWFDEDNYLLVLKSDGKYTAYEYPNISNGTYEDTWWGKWVYDSEKKLLIFYYENSKDVEDAYYIVSVSENKLEVQWYDYEEDRVGGYGTFVRISDSEVPTIYIH